MFCGSEYSTLTSLVAQIIKASAWNEGDPGSIPGSGRCPWRRKWQLTPVLLPGKFHGWTEEPGRLQSMGSQRVEHDWVTSLLLSLIYVFRRRQWHPTPVLLPGKSHGRSSLVGCSPWDRWQSDTTERLDFHFSLSCIGEGNGNPLHYSCPENPRDEGAWWAAISGVAQSRTRLKRLSSCSIYVFGPKERVIIYVFHQAFFY